jgi:RNA polymerase subunit RPABC4/transcription elongation factor Spt4
MALWVCTKCTTKYAVGAPQCPNCGTKAHYEDGEKKKKK